jgi:hypothetical protein
LYCRPNGRIYASSIQVAGTYQQFGAERDVSEITYLFRFDAYLRSKEDSCLRGVIDWGIKGSLGFDKRPGKSWNKAEDRWIAQLNWCKLSEKCIKTTFLFQLESPVINTFDENSRLLQERFLLPAVIHLAYGWSVQSLENGWRFDFLPADLSLRTEFISDDDRRAFRYAEAGQFVRFELRRMICSNVLSTLNLEGEFSNSRKDGYSFRTNGRVDWEIWRPFKLSLITSADRDRTTRRSRWSIQLTLGMGLSHSH